jgi:hypothetical protein
VLEPLELRREVLQRAKRLKSLLGKKPARARG